jgi:uncharacterized membrane protein YraQ (UPF0718 family)
MQDFYKIPLGFLHMIWDIYWGLALGFMLSSMVRVFVPTSTISARLGRNTAGAVFLSSFFGAISSSCSYAAASMSRTLLLKGSTWSNAVVFMVASTNLVFEIFIVIVTLLGWAFFGGEIAGGLIFIVLSALVIAGVYPSKVKREAIKNASTKEAGEGHDIRAYHEMHGGDGGRGNAAAGRMKGWLPAKLAEAAGHFYMDVMMVGKDILIGVAIASVLMVVVPPAFWEALFLSNNSHLPHLAVLAWNTLIGIVIAILAFVCSVGNIVMASVLWRGGISFGGVIAFILADLVTVPMLLVYRKYYGLRTMWFLLITLTGCIFVTALLVDLGFSVLHWIPASPVRMTGMDHAIRWNWQAWLNVVFIPLSLLYFFWGKRSMK